MAGTQHAVRVTSTSTIVTTTNDNGSIGAPRPQLMIREELMALSRFESHHHKMPSTSNG
jgi:hypothetical protein